MKCEECSRPGKERVLLDSIAGVYCEQCWTGDKKEPDELDWSDDELSTVPLWPPKVGMFLTYTHVPNIHSGNKPHRYAGQTFAITRADVDEGLRFSGGTFWPDPGLTDLKDYIERGVVVLHHEKE